MRELCSAQVSLAFRRTFQGIYSGNVLFTYLDNFLHNYADVLNLPEDAVRQEADEFILGRFKEPAGEKT